MQQSRHSASFLPDRSSTTPALFAGRLEEQAAGPNICLLAPHLQQEWDHAANAHMGKIIVAPMSRRKVWWRSGVCKTGQPHKWQAQVSNRTVGAGCPYDSGTAVCPCNDLAHNHPKVAAEWDWNANGARTPETVAAGSAIKAAWRCGLCWHSWTAAVLDRTRVFGTGCPQCAHEARRHGTKQPSISDGSRHLLAEWDWEANARRGWHPDKVTLRSHRKVHWVVQDECKLGLVHRWQASPDDRTGKNAGSPFPSGRAVCACNSLAVQCPEAAVLWDPVSNGELTPGDVAMQSNKVMAWKGPDGRQWQQQVREVARNAKRQHIRSIKAALMSWSCDDVLRQTSGHTTG